MTNKENELSHAIIHGASVATGSVGFGLAQIPGSDNLVIMPIQTAMIISLGKVFGNTIDKSVALVILSELTAGIVGRGASQVLLGWIPGFGNVINAVTASGITEAIGWTAVKYFEEEEVLISNN